MQPTEEEKHPLSEAQHQLELYRASSLGGVFTVVVDEYFTLLYGNDKYYSIHEYTKESMRERLGNRCYKHVHPEDLDMVKKTISSTLRAGKDYTEWVMRVVTGKAHIRYILCSGRFVQEGNHFLMNGVVMGSGGSPSGK